MTGLALSCPSCRATALADDEFCESCGAALAGPRDAVRHHLEVDGGVAAGVTDRGLVHRRNEDACFVEVVGATAVVAVVCDGVSTSAAPDIAAQVAADTVGRSLSGAVRETLDEPRPLGPGWDPAGTLIDAITAAGKAVDGVPWMAAGDRDAPSCTVVAAVWDGTTATVGWAGDSRAYWFGTDGSERLTVDHSWAQAQVDAGLMTADAAEADRRAHAITRWLGSDAPDDLHPVTSFTPSAPGHLVLCSDGLWNHVPTTEELAGLIASQPPDAPAIDIARALTRAALSRGGHDNVTVVVVDIRPAMSGAEQGRKHDHVQR